MTDQIIRRISQQHADGMKELAAEVNAYRWALLQCVRMRRNCADTAPLGEANSEEPEHCKAFYSPECLCAREARALFFKAQSLGPTQAKVDP